MRFALALEYDGRGFCGFQSQASGCGVQDAIARALSGIAGESLSATAAGRTDAGVHATSQIVHFDTSATRPLSAWTRGVNTLLPVAAAALWAQPVSDHFHARYTASARHYTYLLMNRPERPGLLAGRVGWYHRPLDLDAMREAAAHLVGTHDFSSFRSTECQAKSPARTMRPIAITAEGRLLRFTFSADGFLHHMVRNIVGALVQVGAGKAPSGWLGELLALRDRSQGAPTFAADGLYLTGVDYHPRFGLPPTHRPVSLPIA